MQGGSEGNQRGGWYIRNRSMTRLAPLLTTRDLDLLQALDHCPMTARQLLKLSETFEQPFTVERKVRGRLQLLAESGRVRRWPLAIAGRGMPHYYVLTSHGYGLLNGPDAAIPTKRWFGPVAIGRQQHTYALADFVVHTAVCAYRAGLMLTGFCR